MKAENFFVGIKNSNIKKLLIKKGKYRFVDENVDALAYGCKGYIDLLERYEKGKDFWNSLYVKTNELYFKRNKEAIAKKIKGFLSLYENMKNNIEEAPIIVTVNKARLDGSHRASILKFLGIKKTKVKEIYAPKYLLWIIGREVSKRKKVFDKFNGKEVYNNGGFKGKVLYTDFVRKDLLSFTGNYYHVLDTGEIIKAEQCYLKE